MEQGQATFRGVVHGNIIALFDDAGLPDGEVVSVVLKPTEMTAEEMRNPGLVKIFGAWAEDAVEFDKFLEWSRERRNVSPRPIEL